MRWAPRPLVGALAVVLALAGGAALAQGIWIPLKAELAQILIERAWHRVRAGELEARPWPWADTWPVARLVLLPGPRDTAHAFPESSLFALAGASGESMAFGPAHVSSSARAGEPDNVVFVGHRDTHFARLEALAPGDVILVESSQAELRYRVEGSEVVHESRTDLLARSGRAELTLITCYPFDAIVPGGPLRYVVHASLIP